MCMNGSQWSDKSSVTADLLNFTCAMRVLLAKSILPVLTLRIMTDLSFAYWLCAKKHRHMNITRYSYYMCQVRLNVCVKIYCKITVFLCNMTYLHEMFPSVLITSMLLMNNPSVLILS